MNKNNLFVKGMIITIIILFINVNIIPSTYGNIKQQNLTDNVFNESVSKSLLWWQNWDELPGHYEPFFNGEDVIEYDEQAYGVTTADFNDDQIMDFAVSYTDELNDPYISIFYNNADKTFTEEKIIKIEDLGIVYPSGAWTPSCDDIDSGDFDNDGDIDLLMTYNERRWSGGLLYNWNGTGVILFNDGFCNFNQWKQVFWHPRGEGYWDRYINPKVTSNDFDKDGDIDFLVGDNSGTVKFYKNNGNVYFTRPYNNDICRAGDTININGTIQGDRFKNYQIEYGQGLDPDEWFTTGIILINDGKERIDNSTIAIWDTGHISESDFYQLRIQVQYWKYKIFSIPYLFMKLLSFNKNYNFQLNLFDRGETYYIKNLYLDTSLREGWPVRIKQDYFKPAYEEGYYIWPGKLMPVVSDINNDGMKEIFVLQQAKPFSYLHCFELNGSYVDGWPQEIKYDYGDSEFRFPTLITPTIIDIDGDGFKEIITSSFTGIKIYNYDGTIKKEFELGVSTQPNAEVPVVDLDHDGNFELIKLYEIMGGDGSYVSVVDLDGNILGDWPQLYYNVRRPYGQSSASATYEAAPAVGNFDDDTDLEIVVVGPRNVFDDTSSPERTRETWHVEGRIIVYNMDGSILDGFPVDVDGWIFKSPVVGDINNDGLDEIVVGSRYSDNINYSNKEYGLFVLNRYGDFLDGWPQLVGVGQGLAHNPSLADFDDDGFLEIVVGTVDSYYELGFSTYIFDYTGEVVSGWPIRTVWYSPVSPTIADIDGDGVCDIVLPAGSGVWPGVEGLGGVYAFNIKGEVLDGFPKITDMEADASVTIDDIDGDGLVELVGSCDGNRDCQTDEKKRLSDIYIWELDGIFNQDYLEWPMFQHDLHYSGWFHFN